MNAPVSERSHSHCGGDFFGTPYPSNRFLRNPVHERRHLLTATKDIDISEAAVLAKLVLS